MIGDVWVPWGAPKEEIYAKNEDRLSAVVEPQGRYFTEFLHQTSKLQRPPNRTFCHSTDADGHARPQQLPFWIGNHLGPCCAGHGRPLTRLAACRRSQPSEARLQLGLDGALIFDPNGAGVSQRRAPGPFSVVSCGLRLYWHQPRRSCGHLSTSVALDRPHPDFAVVARSARRMHWLAKIAFCRSTRWLWWAAVHRILQLWWVEGMSPADSPG